MSIAILHEDLPTYFSESQMCFQFSHESAPAHGCIWSGGCCRVGIGCHQIRTQRVPTIPYKMTLVGPWKNWVVCINKILTHCFSHSCGSYVRHRYFKSFVAQWHAIVFFSKQEAVIVKRSTAWNSSISQESRNVKSVLVVYENYVGVYNSPCAKWWPSAHDAKMCASCVAPGQSAVTLVMGFPASHTICKNNT